MDIYIINTNHRYPKMDIYKETNNCRYSLKFNLIQMFKHIDYHIDIYFCNILSRDLSRYLSSYLYRVRLDIDACIQISISRQTRYKYLYIDIYRYICLYIDIYIASDSK